MLELNEILDIFNEGKTLRMDEEAAETCNYYSQEAQKITCEINYVYHDFDEIRELFSKLIGMKVSDDFRLFPPFTTDFGKNIHLGKNVFINSGCRFQDQGGICIGDNVLIGHNVVLATLNHEENPQKTEFPKILKLTTIKESFKNGSSYSSSAYHPSKTYPSFSGSSWAGKFSAFTFTLLSN